MTMTKIETFRLHNSHGTEVHFVNLGATVTKILFDGINVAVGPEKISHNPSYAGAIVGRVANRIRNAEFKLEGKTFTLYENDGRNSLHGGERGFDKHFWKVEEVSPGKKYRLSLTSPHLEEGYPGNLKVTVTYSLDENDAFLISYEAETDQTTHVNLTSHCYFNLSGIKGSTILDHELQIEAETYTESGEGYLPTGKILPVAGALDFRKAKPIGKDISFNHDGYNHNFILTGKALLRNPASGRSLEVKTTEPGLMVYTGFYLDLPYAGVALEAQHFPDSPNRPEFPSTVLRPGEKYRQETSYRFFK
jgi:aldose 1-epimerase